MIRTHVLRSVALTSLAASLVVACSFPEHSFIPDDEFNNGGNAGNGNAGSGGTGASTSGGSSGNSFGGDAGSTSGGTSGVGGDAGAAGTAAQGGTGGTSGQGGSAGIGGGGTGGAAGMAGTGGSSGGTGTEDCTNGVDDDGDNKADCEDTKCQSVGYQCLALPPGWNGPVEVYAGSASPPGCTGSFPLTSINAFQDLNVPMATCSACTCTNPTGATCKVPVLKLYSDSACSSGIVWSLTGGQNGETLDELFAMNACVNSSVSAGPGGELPGAVGSELPPTTGGSCIPGGGAATRPPTSWNTKVRGCGGPDGGWQAAGCGANTCVPPSAGAFNRGLCVYQVGDVSCPSGAFSSKSVYYQNSNDQRACTACTCDSPVGVTCSGAKLDAWNGLGCAGSVAATVNPPGIDCKAVATGAEKSFKYTVGTATGGSCPPQGGQPTGTATPVDAVTFCCTQ
ncbi:MAG: hypothetical protein R3B07_29805 [Polyangiaceae bacterium]